jgi:hypothetical protein
MSVIEFDSPPENPRPVKSIETQIDLRRSERALTDLKTIVQVNEGDDCLWKEVTKVNTVSRNGVGVSLSRSCTVGRLVNLILPMPKEFRAYDEDLDLYEVMGIIQHCNASTVDGKKVYHIGIGLIGRDMPESFKADPTQNYRITGMQKDGFWAVTESESQFTKRKKPRTWLTMPVTIALIQREEKSLVREETFTKNISAGGVSVTTTLNASIGDKVKFACKLLDFYSIAIVRNRKRVDDDTSTLHLEFEGAQFPTDKLLLLQRSAG